MCIYIFISPYIITRLHRWIGFLLLRCIGFSIIDYVSLYKLSAAGTWGVRAAVYVSCPVLLTLPSQHHKDTARS